MNSPKQSVEIAIGYRVEPAGNGGWVLTANYRPGDFGLMLGAFTNAADLIAHLSSEHQRIEDRRAAVVAKERADKLGLEEQVVQQARRGKFGTLPTSIAPAGQYRMVAHVESVSGPERVPGNEFATEDHDDLGVARRSAILHCERGRFAFVYNDQGELVAEMRP